MGIAFCVTQSAMFSGLNLAFFSLSRLRLEVEATHNARAAKVLAMRQDSNFLLTTILWGNVAINTLLALLSNSVMVGVMAFMFSTFVITIFGEILPQAYFSRNALKMASLLTPVLKIYQILLYPVARPTAWMLDRWLGVETIQLMREKILKEVILKHIVSEEAEIENVEGIGALNFLDIDDMLALEEGEPIEESSVISLPVQVDLPVPPPFEARADDPFLIKVNASGKKWVILTDLEGTPQLLLQADNFLRDVFFSTQSVDFYHYCHRPLLIENEHMPLGDVIWEMKHNDATSEDGSPIRRDVALVWTPAIRQVITGADILGRLLLGMSADVVAHDSS